METDYVEFRKPSYPPMEPGWNWHYARISKFSPNIEPVPVFCFRTSKGLFRKVEWYGRPIDERDITWFGPVHKIREG